LADVHPSFRYSNRAGVFLKSNAKAMLRSPDWEDCRIARRRLVNCFGLAGLTQIKVHSVS
jgi:hypothetical protein